MGTHQAGAMEVILEIMLCTGQGVPCWAHPQVCPQGMADVHCAALKPVRNLGEATRGKLASLQPCLAPACVILTLTARLRGLAEWGALHAKTHRLCSRCLKPQGDCAGVPAVHMRSIVHQDQGNGTVIPRNQACHLWRPPALSVGRALACCAPSLHAGGHSVVSA